MESTLNIKRNTSGHYDGKIDDKELRPGFDESVLTKLLDDLLDDDADRTDVREQLSAKGEATKSFTRVTVKQVEPNSTFELNGHDVKLVP